jgi:predicted Rossmann-fold nucleotide-binding protein
MKKRIGVIGGRKLGDKLSEEIAYACGIQIVERGFQLITGGVSGAGLLASQGAYDYLKNKGIPHKEYIISVVPIGMNPDHDYGKVLYKGSTWEERRIELIKLARCFLAISGAAGTTHEIECTLKDKKILLPFACTGGAAASVWQHLKKMDKALIPSELINVLGPHNKNKKHLLDAAFNFIDKHIELL